MPIMIMAAVTSMYHAKIGISLKDIPGARVLRMPTISSTAAATAEISTKPSPSTHTSVLRPGEYFGPVSGGYMNQPPSGAMLKNRLAKTSAPPSAYDQYPNAERRGKGMS